MRVHFISIGGAVMHNMAIALKNKGFNVTGSDDEIYEPAKSRLMAKNILPEKFGWFEENINETLNAIILGMHAKADNPELIKAKKLGLKIYSFPEYMFEQTKNKKRIVVGGSHGKTSTTAMILHVLKKFDIEFDYLVGSQIEGFDTMVGFSNASKIAVFEGDEYLTSALDLRPKFHLYKGNVGIITGIAWDHINVFPTFEIYLEQFRIFVEEIPAEGAIIYCADDSEVQKLIDSSEIKSRKIPYKTPPYEINNGATYLVFDDYKIALKVFGNHNLQNMMAAKFACNEAGLSDKQFYEAIGSFKGTAKRMETLFANEDTLIIRDFAHAPSKLKATVHAVKNLHPDRKLIAVYELHTFSSLNKNFLNQYKDSMELADIKVVFYSKHALEMKKLEMLNEEEIASNFGNDVIVFSDKHKLHDFIKSKYSGKENLLLMSSGTFDGMELNFY